MTDASGQWEYMLKDVGTTITGYAEAPSGNLVIPGELDGYTVTGIGDEAFGDCYKITSVIIPDGVMSTGNWAFVNCVCLTSIRIPDNVTSISSNAFYDCKSLTSVTIPQSVTSIGYGAFSRCDKAVLYVKEVSYAEKYATENHISWIDATLTKITPRYAKNPLTSPIARDAA